MSHIRLGLTFALAAFAASTAWSPAIAGETASVRAGEAVISYDPTLWRRDGGAVLTCIAPECAERRDEPPSVFVFTRPWEPGRVDTCVMFGGRVPDGRDPRLLSPLRISPLGFTAVTRWSGCRALDAPILEACAVHNGVVYELTTVLEDGCNRSAPVPEDLFTQLIGGIRLAP